MKFAAENTPRTDTIITTRNVVVNRNANANVIASIQNVIAAESGMIPLELSRDAAAACV
ncbi:MAG: hypothetical protein WC082_01935 [Victivallales bacterium]